MSVTPGWYKDPADPLTQRYWDGEGWLGEPIPANAEPPAGPPPEKVILVAPSQDQAVQTPPIAVTPTAPINTGSIPGTPPGWPAGYPYSRTAPPPRPHGYLLAGAGSRFVARLVDILVLTVLCVIANAWFAVQWWQAIEPVYTETVRRIMAGESTDNLPVPPTSASTLLLLILVTTTLLWFAYEVPGSANTGQTLGKRLLGIKVVRLESDERLGFGRSFRRWGRLGLPTLLWYCYGIGFLLQFIDCLFVVIDRPLRQALHDKAAATVVVQVSRTKPHNPAQLPDATTGGRHADSR